MPIDFKSIFDLTKTPTRIFAAIAICCGIILISGPNLIKFLRIEKQYAEYGYIVGISFFLSSGILFVSFIIYIYNKISASCAAIRHQKQMVEKLKKLDPSEIMAIRLFFISKSNTLVLSINNAIISSLLDKGILKINMPLGSGYIVQGFDYNTNMSISDEARRNIGCIIDKILTPATDEEMQLLKSMGFVPIQD